MIAKLANIKLLYNEISISFLGRQLWLHLKPNWKSYFLTVILQQQVPQDMDLSLLFIIVLLVGLFDLRYFNVFLLYACCFCYSLIKEVKQSKAPHLYDYILQHRSTFECSEP